MKIFLIFLILYSNVSYSQNVTSFSFNDLGSGVQIIDQTIKGRFVDRGIEIKNFSPTKHMPLYLSSQQNGKNFLIYMGVDERKKFVLVFFNLNKWKSEEIIEFDDFYSESTPVIDEETSMIYLFGRSNTPNIYKLYSYNYTKKQKQIVKVNLNEVYIKNYPQVNIEGLNNVIDCKTSLKLFKTDQGKKIFWGCSTPHHYGEYRGVMGLVGALKLDLNGNAIANSLQTFLTSKITDNLNTGYNTGVFHLGGGFAFIPPHHIIVYTGNGPSFPKDGNYGCGILKLNTNTFQVDDFLLFDDENYHECFSNNLDYSTSSPALVKNSSDQYTGIAIGSSGFLQLYDPKDLKNSAYKLPSFFARNRHIKGMGNALKIDDNHFQFIYVGSNDAGDILNLNDFFSTAENKKTFRKQGFIQKKLIGYISDKPFNNSSELELFYSGKYRNIFIATATDSKFNKLITSTDKDNRLLFPGEVSKINSHFNKISQLGHIAKIQLKNLVPLYTRFNDGDVSNTLKNDNNNFLEGYISKSKDKIFNTPLYLFNQQIKNNSENWNIKSVIYNFKTKELKPHWTYQGFTDTLSPLTHISTLNFKNKKITLIYSEEKKKSLTHLYLIDASNGKLLDQINFKGHLHRTIGIFAKNRIFLAREDAGIISFGLE